MCRSLIICKQRPCSSPLDKLPSAQTSNSSTWARALELGTPCSLAGVAALAARVSPALLKRLWTKPSRIALGFPPKRSRFAYSSPAAQCKPGHEPDQARAGLKHKWLDSRQHQLCSTGCLLNLCCSSYKASRVLCVSRELSMYTQVCFYMQRNIAGF